MIVLINKMDKRRYFGFFQFDGCVFKEEKRYFQYDGCVFKEEERYFVRLEEFWIKILYQTSTFCLESFCHWEKMIELPSNKGFFGGKVRKMVVKICEVDNLLR